MNRRWRLSLVVMMATSMVACNNLPGRPAPASNVLRPSQQTDFATLYAQNCAACHGARGEGGAAIALADPIYLATVSDKVLRSVTSNGIPGTPMPAFAQSSGGMLTSQQVAALVDGIRAWARPATLNSAHPPPYAADVPGEAERGAIVYQNFCASCHGPSGTGGKAGSIVDPSFLALVSDQGLRTIVITGRPELDAPDWRNDAPGHPMTDQQISDVVAWTAAHRVRYPGQPYPSNGAKGAEGVGQ
ncbi:MAG: c-type cytochrome [Candidatus Acidiferrales bacterium]